MVSLRTEIFIKGEKEIKMLKQRTLNKNLVALNLNWEYQYELKMYFLFKYKIHTHKIS